MIADSAITGGNLEERQREFALKISPSADGKALIGFSGDQHHGTRLMHHVAGLAAGQEALNFLIEGQREYQSTEFAYAYEDKIGFHLFRISGGSAQALPAFHLGIADAFDHFQRVQHDASIDYAPEAIKTFFAASRASDPIPNSLGQAITSLLRVFAERTGRDVGGWVTSYWLSREGAFLCGYGYAVSDPILSVLGPGSIVPHGSAEHGGFGLSVTELGNRRGVVVYWLQQPGGRVFVKTEDGYKALSIEGRPSDFIARATAAVGEKVEIFFGEQPPGRPDSITVLHDETGRPSMAVAKHGDTFSFSVLNVQSPFKSKAAMNLDPTKDNRTRCFRATTSTSQFQRTKARPR